eukprot:1159357-Pelagomonas_calceolata.AAC.3
MGISWCDIEPRFCKNQKRSTDVCDIAWGSRIQQLLSLVGLLVLGAWWMAEDRKQLALGQCRSADVGSVVVVVVRVLKVWRSGWQKTAASLRWGNAVQCHRSDLVEDIATWANTQTWPIMNWCAIDSCFSSKDLKHVAYKCKELANPTNVARDREMVAARHSCGRGSEEQLAALITFAALDIGKGAFVEHAGQAVFRVVRIQHLAVTPMGLLPSLMAEWRSVSQSFCCGSDMHDECLKDAFDGFEHLRHFVLFGGVAAHHDSHGALFPLPGSVTSLGLACADGERKGRGRKGKERKGLHSRACLRGQPSRSKEVPTTKPGMHRLHVSSVQTLARIRLLNRLHTCMRNVRWITVVCIRCLHGYLHGVVAYVCAQCVDLSRFWASVASMSQQRATWPWAKAPPLQQRWLTRNWHVAVRQLFRRMLLPAIVHYFLLQLKQLACSKVKRTKHNKSGVL